MQKLKITCCLMLALVLASCGMTRKKGVGSEDKLTNTWQKAAGRALADGMSALKAEKGQADLLILTNAGCARANGDCTISLADIARRRTGCTVGTGSLLFVHAPDSAPLWFTLFRSHTHEAVFAVWNGEGFERQKLDLSPDHILAPENWKNASEGPAGKKLFQVVSFCLVWSEAPSWGLLKSSELHNHICPGVNAGYVLAEYIKRQFPLEQGQKYTFMAAPPSCPVDAIQTVFDATGGKRSMFTVQVSEKSLSEHFQGEIQPTLIAMRSGGKSAQCDGLVLGFDWEQNCTQLGLDRGNFSPPGGKSNPLFFISRAKAAWKMAAMPMEKKLLCVKVLRRFSGEMGLVREITRAQSDPYDVIEHHK